MFCLKSLRNHQLSISFFLIFLKIIFSLILFLFLLQFIYCWYYRAADKDLYERFNFKIKIKEVTSFDLYSKIKTSLSWFELRIGSLINVIISLELLFIDRFLIFYCLKSVLIFLLFFVFILIFISILFSGFHCFRYCIEAILICSSSFSLTNHSYILWAQEGSKYKWNEFLLISFFRTYFPLYCS